MARAVLDPGVLVSALITPTGTPAKLLTATRDGSFELIVSPLLLEELEMVLGREKFRRYVDLGVVDQYVELLRRDSAVVADPAEQPPTRCADPDDDYLIALAHSCRAALVSGDRHLLALAGEIPVFTPSEFLASQVQLPD
ncbi:MAG TPA: putative toxin-antitoxin system toxin component, PIN family [Solirubrobacterales bacterium]|nr:putative toxin-antitoxin system toxin component, PIN family [Solirubrobacterales bacterium]